MLDEVILQVFEESSEAFHFPVTSQKDARAFVKALHKKGLSYDSLSHEIKEPEQNFSAWRTGISRPGIGSRVLERINRPLQDVLLSDGEDDCAGCDQLSACSYDPEECEEANYNGDISFHGTTESKYAGTNSSGQKLDGEGVVKKAGKLGDSSKLNGSKRSDESLDKVSGEKGQGDRITEKCDEQAKEISSVVANGSNAAIKKKTEVASKQNDRTLIGHDSSVVRPSETKTGQDLKPVKAKKPDVGKVVKKAANTENAVEHEELKDHGMKNAACGLTNVAVESSDGIHSKDAVSHDKTLSEDRLLPPEEHPSVLTKAMYAENEELLERQEPRSAEEESAKCAKESQSLSLLEGVDGERNPTSNNPEDLLNRSKMRDGTGPSAVQADVNTKTDATFTGPRCSADVLENYDSDLDNELVDDDFADVTEIENEIGKEATKESGGRDFGYVYAFTDTESDVGEFRVKVGASRFPHKRLKQARLFNIDMKLVSTVKVSHRQRALAAVRQHLSDFAMPNTTGWFRGPLDKILSVLMSATKNHPVRD